MYSKAMMIEQDLQGRDIQDKRVLAAMEEVDRRLFVPDDLQNHAYEDSPLPLGKSQTISQPYIVAYMAQVLDIKADDKVLEIGTGCGYNAAILSRLAKEVYSIEIIEWLAELAKINLAQTEYDNIHIRFGDGYQGWPEQAPFDVIELTAAPPKVPQSLKQQLKTGGRLVAPVGTLSQELVLVERLSEQDFSEKVLSMVRFVPMTGQAQQE